MDIDRTWYSYIQVEIIYMYTRGVDYLSNYMLVQSGDSLIIASFLFIRAY